LYIKRWSQAMVMVLTLTISFSTVTIAGQDTGEEAMETNYPDQLVFVGTSTRQRGQGIYTYRLDSDTGVLRLVTVNRVNDNPSWLALHPNEQYLYAVNEVNQYQGIPQGYVSSFRIEDDGKLQPLNVQGTKSRGPCYVSVDRSGSYVFTANFVDGSFTVFPIMPDGSLGEASDLILHESKSDGTKPYAHSILADLSNQYVFGADLGLDKLAGFQLDTEAGKLIPMEVLNHQFPKGTGPRHLMYHPSGEFLYVINETASTITTFKFLSDSPGLEGIGTVSTLPEGVNQSNSSADIHIHPSGQFLYGSNRGYNSIAAFVIDQMTGELSPIDQRRTGKTPRGFTIDSTGKFLIVACQDSGSVSVYPINQQNGMIEDPVSTVSVPAPLSVVTIFIRN
jgi:6-phosphogluconolactonase